MSQPLVVVIADPSRPAYEQATREALAEPGWELRLATGFDDKELVDWAADTDVLITRRRPIPPQFLARAKCLQSVQHIGGVPRPEVVVWAAEHGVELDITPSLGNIAVAEQALALLLALTRRVVSAHNATARGAYQDYGLEPTPTTEVQHGFQWLALERLRLLYGATVGVIGLGDIGRAFATRVGALGTHVLYYQRHRLDRVTEAELKVDYRTLDDLIAEVDVLSLHLPHTSETEHLINAERLAKMKPGALLINVSRGGLVDEEALVTALQSGQLGGAGLDVFALEPVPHDHPLLSLETVCLSPHIGAAPARGLGESMARVKPHILQFVQNRKAQQ